MTETQWNQEKRAETSGEARPVGGASGFKPGDESEPQPIYDMGSPGGERYARAALPLRIVFGDMAGFVFLVWFPIFFCFFLGWTGWLGTARMPGMPFNVIQLVVAAIIAFPPWIVLWRHLVRGRLWDGILDMFLWAIWESTVMIMFCYFFPGIAGRILWHASDYWTEMSNWIATGVGAESHWVQWLPIHVRHLIMLLIGALIFGYPALIMGVFQLNYMNYYVAQCMLNSANGLLVLPIAWNFWGIVRVAGYIVLASTVFQLVFKWIRRAPATAAAIVGGFVIGLLLIVLDGYLKWQFAEQVRITLKLLVNV